MAAETLDRFGAHVSAASAATVSTWDDALGQLIEFTGDPIAALATVNEADEGFVVGPVLAAAGRLLGAWSPAHPLVRIDVQRAVDRATTDGDQGHAAALELLAAGEFHLAARRWDAVAAVQPNDLLAIRLAHDVTLHCGDAQGRLTSSEAAWSGWSSNDRGRAVIAGQLAFALEELGRYDEAETWGRTALDIAPGDLWARHALAHVFESQGRHNDSVELLWPTRAEWGTRELFAHHIWWHYALRLLASGDHVAAGDVLDRQLTSTTAFGLCDTTSLVWRMELAGIDVGDRWPVLADRWSVISERHNAAFVDVHAAMAFASVGGAEADRFWDGLAASHHAATSENDVTFQTVVGPLASSLRAIRGGDIAAAVDAMRGILPTLHRIGGSAIQREIVALTIAASDTAELDRT